MSLSHYFFPILLIVWGTIIIWFAIFRLKPRAVKDLGNPVEEFSLLYIILLRILPWPIVKYFIIVTGISLIVLGVYFL
ncbi:hypothetical protein CDB3_29790 [Bacillus sp. CDB3]|nr:hypothetical protein CDB3_29790 [Bacillus sp. CDB3]